ncbi:MAG: ABC transporter permease [Acidobacteria bacterium]|nr:ABC transporter permease [Acidobacteriota bacterium]
MKALGFAWRSLVRQPARAALGILGVAAVGALLFDMLLLSEGLVTSMRDLLDRTGYDIRVTATEALPGRGPRVTGASGTADALGALPHVRSAIAIRLADARLEGDGGVPLQVGFQGVAGGPGRPWTVLRGRDVQRPGEVVINEGIAGQRGLGPGDRMIFRPACDAESDAPPAVTLEIAGVAEFPFEAVNEGIAAGMLETIDTACGTGGRDEADLILVASTGDTDAAAAAAAALRPDLHAVTNSEVIERFSESGFTYFRQISAVLSAVTITFALLLITVLLTVSVNQRLGEIAALRALGLSQQRVVANVFCESALIVGAGGLLSLPLGILLAVWLDRILKSMPGLPAEMHFFVFQADALVLQVALLATTAVLAALYPMRIVARLPIAETLRNEVVS